MKVVLRVLGIGAVMIVAFYLWLTRAPTTELVDASGKGLTAGVEVGPAEESAGARFEAERRLLETGRYAEARERLVALLETSDRDGEACILLSEAARRLGDAAESVDYGLKAVELLPESAAAHLAYARALGLQMLTGNRLAAIGILPRWKGELARAIELDPGDIEARTDLAFFHMYTPGIVGGDVDRALELASEIEAIDSIRGKQILAMAHHQKGETERAVEICLAALEEAPGARALRNTLAGFYGAQENEAEADAAYEAARRGPKDEHYYRSLYMQAQMWIEAEHRQEEALQHLEEFIAARPTGDLMPSVAHAWWRKGKAFEKLGRIDEARSAYAESLRLDPKWQRAQAALDELDELDERGDE